MKMITSKLLRWHFVLMIMVSFTGLTQVGAEPLSPQSYQPTYLVILQPDTPEEEFEQWLQKEVFPKLEIFQRNVYGVTHELFKTKGQEGNPRYLWRPNIQFIGTPTHDLYDRLSAEMTKLLGEKAHILPKFSFVSDQPGNGEGKDHTHLVVRKTPYYLTSPQQGLPPDGEWEPGTQVALLEEESGSFHLVRGKDGVQGFVQADDIQPLGTHGPQVSAHMNALQEQDVPSRIRAAQALGGIGHPATPAVPLLQKVAEKDVDEYVRHFAKEAVGMIQQPNPLELGIHGMLVVSHRSPEATSPIYLSHLPMYVAPHRFQGIWEVSLDKEGEDSYRHAQMLDNRGGKPLYPYFTLVPTERFALRELNNTRTTFQAKLFGGHFERSSGKFLKVVDVTIKNPVYWSKLHPKGKRPSSSEFIAFGQQSDDENNPVGTAFFSHKITIPENYDQILNVRVMTAPSSLPINPVLQDGTIVTAKGRDDTKARKFASSDKHSPAFTKHISAGSSDTEAHQYVLGILGQYYLEEEELRENHLAENMP